MLIPRLVIRTIAVGLMLLGPGLASGQDFPSKPIRIVTSQLEVATISRPACSHPSISSSLGQPVIVDNRGGRVISAEAVSKAPPDGYTLLYNGQSLWLEPLLQKVSLRYEGFRTRLPGGERDLPSYCAPIVAGKVRKRVDRISQSQARTAQLWFFHTRRQ